MKILTFTMINIAIQKYFIQSPFVTCILQIREDEAFVCQIHHMWVPKGQGKIVIRIENQLDFRTLLQVDMSKILEVLLSDVQELKLIYNVRMYDQTTSLTDCGDYVFENIWHFCNNGLMIKDVFFDINEFYLTMRVEDI